MDILEMINGDGRVHATYHWKSNYPAKNCTQVLLQLSRAHCHYMYSVPSVSAAAAASLE
jgi:hypothetical protein